jgi:hypothetical protein
MYKQVKDVAEQVHTLTSCRVFKTGYTKIPNWGAWGAEWEGDDEDWESRWGLVEEDEWFESPEGEEEGDQDGRPTSQPPCSFCIALQRLIFFIFEFACQCPLL